MSADPVATAPPTARVDVPAVVAFLLVALGGGWLAALPLWLSGQGLATPGTVGILLAVMLTPALGVLVVVGLLRRHRGEVLRTTGLRSAGGFRSWVWWAVAAWFTPLVLVVLSLVLAAAVGLFEPDLAGFSGFREVLRSAGAGDLPIPVQTLVGLQVVQVLLLGWLNVVPALAEEWGWRGWLLPALLPWGRWPAIVAVGVVWGLWHAPAVLLGYNYPLQPAPLRLLLMVVFCVVGGALLGWLRLVSDSVWPCAVAHGMVNAAAGLPLVVATAGRPVDNATTGLLGWTGWVVMAVVLAAVALVLRRRRAPA